MENKKNVNIGLDIGTASVGWSIIDDDFNLIDLGVRLFNEVTDPKTGLTKTSQRRDFRHIRRQINRKAHRRDHLIKILVKYKFLPEKNSKKEFFNIVALPLEKYNAHITQDVIKRGMSAKLSNEEIIRIAYYYMKNRGIFYDLLGDSDSQEKENDKTLKNILAINEFPYEKILSFYEKNGYFNENYFSYKITNKSICKEAEALFKNQNLNNEFISEYIKALSYINDYAHGPNGDSKYGIAHFQKQYENNELPFLTSNPENLWDANVGHCSFYKNELRGYKNSPITDVYNLVNDLINYLNAFKNGLFDSSMISQLINEILKNIMSTINAEKFMKDFKQLTFKNLKKIISGSIKEKIINLDLDITDEIIEDSFLIDTKYGNEIKKEEVKINSVSTFLLLYQVLCNSKSLIMQSDISKELILKVNSLFMLFSNIQNEDQFNNKFEIFLNSNNLKNVANYYDEIKIKLKKAFSIKKFSVRSSLSNKIMVEFIDDTIGGKNTDNYSAYSFIRKTEFPDIEYHGKYIPINTDNILSPNVKRSYIQTVHILNRIIQLHPEYQIKTITIEVPREKNTKEMKKNHEDFQKRREGALAKILDEKLEVKEAYAALNEKQQLSLKELIILWNEQSEWDLYNDNHIEIHDLLSKGKYEIDHIIPYSLCNNNSNNNKHITTAITNKEKYNQTPYQYLSSKGKDFKAFKQLVNEKVYIRAKKNNLLFMGDPMDTLMNSKSGNKMADTGYVAKAIFEDLNKFFKQKNTKILSVRGGVTTYFRRNYKFEVKNRNLMRHHAVDATIIAYLGMNPSLKKFTSFDEMISRQYDKNKNKMESLKQELLATYENNDTESLKKIRNSLENKEVKFSRKLNRPNNISFANQTIYGYKNIKTEKYEKSHINIMDANKANVAKMLELFKKEKCEKWVIFQTDKKLYNNLLNIFNKYYDDSQKNNPFIKYMEENYPDKCIDIIDNKSKEMKIYSYLILNNKVYKKFTILSSKVPKSVISLRSHNNKSYITGLNAIYWIVGKNIKNQIKVIPVNCLLAKSIFDSKKNSKLVLDNAKLQNFLKKNCLSIINDYKFYRGQVFKYFGENKGILEYGEEYYISGSGNDYRMEIKYLKKLTPSPQKFININDLVDPKKCLFLKKDILGIYY